jgi:hypothetical protein
MHLQCPSYSFPSINFGFMTTPSRLLNHLTIFPGLLVDFFKESSHEGNISIAYLCVMQNLLYKAKGPNNVAYLRHYISVMPGEILDLVR